MSEYRTIYRPAGGWGEMTPRLKVVSNDLPPPPSTPAFSWARRFFIVVKWGLAATVSIPLCVLGGVWFGCGGVVACFKNMCKELKGD